MGGLSGRSPDELREFLAEHTRERSSAATTPIGGIDLARYLELAHLVCGSILVPGQLLEAAVRLTGRGGVMIELRFPAHAGGLLTQYSAEPNLRYDALALFDNLAVWAEDHALEERVRRCPLNGHRDSWTIGQTSGVDEVDPTGMAVWRVCESSGQPIAPFFGLPDAPAPAELGDKAAGSGS
ncbi:hypothetical protein [Cryptosporangium japonicum]|uniref:Uncharacterized protein n=1 Tax=Cryptosporangium japonicum TaxID=80872 RepID=A0ABP3ENR6_9ACTN